MKDTIEIGRVVLSKSGRDMNKYFIIVAILNNEYIYIADGGVRSIDKPKKKKIKHVVFTDIVAEDIKQHILANELVSNAKIKRFLQSNEPNKEV